MSSYTDYETFNIPFSDMLCLLYKKAYRGTKPEESFGWRYRSLFFLLFLSFISTGSDSCFWEFHPSSVILGVFVFFILIFCESLHACIKIFVVGFSQDIPIRTYNVLFSVTVHSNWSGTSVWRGYHFLLYVTYWLIRMPLHL